MVSDHTLGGESIGPQSRLMVRACLRLADGAEIPITALVDTGAEISLLCKGLVRPEYFRRSARPKKFITASQAVMEGGLSEVACQLVVHGVDMDTRVVTQVACPTTFYDTSLGVDAILSYDWLRQNDVEIKCRRHGLMVNCSHRPTWVAGIVSSAATDQVPQGINRVVGQTPTSAEEDAGVNENYTVRGPFVQEITKGLRVEPQRDCFAAEGNQRFSTYWTREENALTKSWNEGEVLWMNPPWRLWPEVAAKLLASTCEAVCVLPAWAKPWTQSLVQVASRWLYFEAGVRMFEVDGRAASNTRWGVWALLVRAGPRKLQGKDMVIKECVFIPRWRPVAAMGQAREDKEHAMAGALTSAARDLDPEEGVKRALVLFSGTGTVTSELSRLGFEVVSLDADPANKATLQTDLLKWDYRRSGLPRGHFHLMFVSLPGEHARRDSGQVEALAQRSVEVVRHFKPEQWFLEARRNGPGGEEKFLKEFPRVDIDYCQFVEWGHRKASRVWGAPTSRV